MLGHLTTDINNRVHAPQEEEKLCKKNKMALFNFSCSGLPNDSTGVKGMLTDSQVQARKSGIGATDISCIFGLNPYKSSYELWAEKTSDIIETLDSERLRYGSYLEPFILSEYGLKTNSIVEKDNNLYIHPDYPFLISHIDGKVKNANILVEAKTVNSFASRLECWGDEFTDEIPEHYLLQCAHEALVYSRANNTSIEVVDLAMWSDQGLKIFTYKKNEKLEDMIIKKAANFWSLVKAKIPPEVNSYEEAIIKFKEVRGGSEVCLPDEKLPVLAELKNVKEQIKVLEKEESQLKANIAEIMKDSEILKDSRGKILATWKKSAEGKRLKSEIVKSLYPKIFDECCEKYSNRTMLIKYKEIV